MCIYDGIGEDSPTRNIAIVAIDPATGDVVYDSFIDNEMRGELETRITHINPVELLLPQTLSTSTYRLIEDVVALSSTDDDRIRIEKLNDENFTPEKSQQIIPEFLKNDNQSILQDILNLPKAVISCIAGLIVYLQDFNLHNILKITGNINRFSIRSKYMQLSGTTLRNLEVFENSSNRSEKGCLFWVLNQTVTRYGNRLLRNWISNPLLRIDEIEKRQEAVHHILCSSHQKLERIRTILSKSPDLEKALCSIYHKKCSVLEFYTVVKSLDKILREIKCLQMDESIFKESRLLSTIIQDIPDLLQDIGDYSQAINEQAAKENDKTNLFNKEGEFPEIVKRKQEIHEVLKDIKDHRRDIRLTLKQPSLEYVTVSQIEFLIEVKNSLIKDVPSDWITISSTKAVTRFHSPFIVSKTQKLSQLKEQLIADANQAWQDFLEQFATDFVRYRKAIQYLATLDCLLSLATIAKQDGYCRPKFVKDCECIEIEEGRHPVITSLLTGQQQYVPNNTHLKDERVMIITGPNMGGKSSYIRQVGLLCMMAQIGSYIPADSAHLSIIDAIYTRMGAADEIFKGRSTFMVELQEASYIMKEATSKSLVILDELGRGTSTHDGLAIAHAALQYFINDVKCFTLFVTHYPSLGGLELSYPGVVGNYHMSFLLHDQEESEDEESITFLYQLVKGQAGKSYGLNVARLADIQPSIIKLAHYQSHHMEANLINTRHEMDMFSDIVNSDSKNLSNILQKVSNDDKGTQSVI
ncbi:hypothetical protein SNE40_011718 [Patella caerulea]|uniref:DNA mismatch repair proteins mutS family domain-containing protein n=1 Tax=Patella caerulea TaxID=87958 RepID=A0AAN8JNB1_PATCE